MYALSWLAGVFTLAFFLSMDIDRMIKIIELHKDTEMLSQDYLFVPFEKIITGYQEPSFIIKPLPDDTNKRRRQ